jgi:predicted GNAT family acetyltransferase
MSHCLDRPIWQALAGRQAGFAQGHGAARRYRADYAPFAATPDDTASSLSALAALVAPGDRMALFTRDALAFPPPLAVVQRAQLDQMLLASARLVGGVPELPATARPLGPDDVPAMIALAALTRPGPFAARSAELGRFLGVFENDALVAMAGERMCLDGHVEISAVCTHPDHRGRGLSSALIATLARAAFDRGETPFLHVFTDNEAAAAVYRRLGFERRVTLHLAVVGLAA